MPRNNPLSDRRLSDEILIARVARRDTTALEILYDRYAPIVMGLSLKITGDPVAAEDVLQETFWQVWQGAATYEVTRGAFSGWLLRIARQLAMDAGR